MHSAGSESHDHLSTIVSVITETDARGKTTVNSRPAGTSSVAIVTALYKRERTGRGSHVGSSLLMNGIWAMGQAMFTKCIIVVDEDVDVKDIADVTLKVCNHIDPERDIQFTMGPIDSLDHASRLPNYGSKMGIDATRKWKEEGFVRPWPDVIKMSDDVRARGDQLWKQAGL